MGDIFCLFITSSLNLINKYTLCNLFTLNTIAECYGINNVLQLLLDTGTNTKSQIVRTLASVSLFEISIHLESLSR